MGRFDVPFGTVRVWDLKTAHYLLHPDLASHAPSTLLPLLPGKTPPALRLLETARGLDAEIDRHEGLRTVMEELDLPLIPVLVAMERAGAVVISYWEPLRNFMPAWGWSLLFLCMIFLLNMASVRVYGETEYWMALIKVVTVIIFLGIGVLTIFGIMGGQYIGLKNFSMGDAPFLGGSLGGQFLTTLGVFLVAGFSFQGTELIGITAGESEEPEKNIPHTIDQIIEDRKSVV